MPFGRTLEPACTSGNIFTPAAHEEGTHMARDRDTGFHSAAGLIRYFDQEDEKALKVPPLVVIGLCVLVSGIVLYVTLAWPV